MPEIELGAFAKSEAQDKVDAYYNNSLNKYFNFFLFPIPQDSASSLQYVPVDQSEWKEGAEIIWQAIPGEEMSALGQKYNSVD